MELTPIQYQWVAWAIGVLTGIAGTLCVKWRRQRRAATDMPIARKRRSRTQTRSAVMTIAAKTVSEVDRWLAAEEGGR